MCDFCNYYHSPKGGVIGKEIKIKPNANPTKLTAFEIGKHPGDDKYGLTALEMHMPMGFIEINYCPICGRKLSEEAEHSDSIRQTIKEVAEEMPALGKYEGDYAFPCGAFGYMDDLYRVDFSCSNCGKRHESVIFGTEIVCDCGKTIKT